jgi:hypothetical protein
VSGGMLEAIRRWQPALASLRAGGKGGPRRQRRTPTVVDAVTD